MKNIFNLNSYILFLSRNKLYTAVTLFGFAIALMFVILMAVYANGEFTKDSFHTKGDRIYMLASNESFAVAAPPIGQDLLGRYPEIESYTRIFNDNGIVEATNQSKYATEFMVVDSTFFTIFDFPLVEGKADEVLNIPSNILLSEEFARKLFGDQNAMGQQVKLDGYSYTVSGIFRQFEESMFTKHDAILPVSHFKLQERMWMLERYNACNYSLILLARPGVDLRAREGDITEFFRTFFWVYKNDPKLEVRMIPLSEMYFDDHIIRGAVHGDRRFLLILISAAMMILLFAVINYINLSVAQSGFRAKEMATRRLMGSPVWELFGKFIFESIVMCAVAFVLGFCLAMAAEPVFNDILQAQISIFDNFTLTTLLIATGFVVLIGLISGIAPAYTITKFKPVEVVKGTFKYRTKKVYSKVLIAFQYCITIVLIGSALTIVEQTSFMRNIDPGYDLDDIYIVPHISDQQPSIREELLAVPGVDRVSFALWQPLGFCNNNTMMVDGVQHSFSIFYGDSLYMDFMNFEILSRTGNISDTAYWINETGFRALGLKEGDDHFRPDGSSSDCALAGVIKDFHFRSMGSGPVTPAMIYCDMVDTHYTAMVKVSSEAAISGIKEVHKKYTEGAPFEGQFASDIWAELSQTEQRQARLIGYLSIIAIVISSLGMLAMANYFIQQRSLEIAVRKIFGSTRTQALRMLIVGFLQLVLMAFIVAVPLIWYFMDSWLMDFAYRISIGWLVFVIAGLVALTVAFVTVFWQSYRAVSRNPVMTLKR